MASSINWIICRRDNKIMLVKSHPSKKFVLPSECKYQKDFLCSIDLDGSNCDLWLCYDQPFYENDSVRWFDFGRIYAEQKSICHDVFRMLPYLAYRIQDFETKKGFSGSSD